MGSRYVQTGTMPIADFVTTITRPSANEYTEDSTPLNEKNEFTDSILTIRPNLSEDSTKSFCEQWMKAINESGIIFWESSNSLIAGCSQAQTSPTTKKNGSGDGSTGSSYTQEN